MEVTSHVLNADGSYRLVVTDDADADHVFTWGPPPVGTSDDAYVAMQRTEALALVAAEVEERAPDSPPVDLLS